MSGNVSEGEVIDPEAAIKEKIKGEFFHNFLKKVTGTGGGEMKAHETSDDGSSTSSQPTPPEYPSPPPPSNSPPESMSSLQTESPILLLDDRNTGGTGPPRPTSNQESTVRRDSKKSDDEDENVNVWMAGHGFHQVPWGGPYPQHPQSILFVHVNDGEALQFHQKGDETSRGSPGTVRMVGEPGATNQPLPIQLRPEQQCHQFVDEEVPQVVGSQHLINAIGGSGGSLENVGNADANAGISGNAGNIGNGEHVANFENAGHAGNVGNVRNSVNVVNAANNGANGGHNQQRPRNGNRAKRHLNGNGQESYTPRYNNGGRGRANRHYNGKARDFHGQRNDNNNHPIAMQGAHQEMVNGRVDGPGLAPMNGEMNVIVGTGQMVPVGQMSLLGEPTGPPMAGPSMLTAPQQPYQQQMMVGEPPEMQLQDMSMAVVPTMMNGPPMQSGLLQDPLMPGPSMSMPPPLYGMHPPNGMMMMPSNGTPFNNNKWIPYQTIEENERIREILSTAMRVPSIANVLPTEVEFLWMPIKLVDWPIVVAGMLVSTDNIEVTYQATVFDFDGKTVMVYLMDAIKFGDEYVSQLLRAHSLRPNNSYQLTLKAMVNERGISGDNTPFLTFRTAPGRPEAPSEVRLAARGINYLYITWSESINNGAFVSAYHVYVHEDEYSDGRMLQVVGQELRIEDLKSQTRYKITINAINALGESLTGHCIEAWTKPTTSPSPPNNIKLTPVSHRSIRVNWDSNPNCYFWIEIFDSVKKTTGLVREHFGGDCTVLGELEPNREYRIRLTARNEFGEGKSDWLTTRTQAFRKIENSPKPNRMFNEECVQRPQAVPNYDRPPSNPFFVRYVDNCPEMEWKSHGPGQREFVYVVEGSTYEAPEKYVQLYRGPAHTLIVVDDTMHYMRVYIIHKKGQRSQSTDRIVIPRDYAQYRPERVLDVKMSMLNEESVLTEWPALDRKAMKLPETAELLYFVQRSELPENRITGTGTKNQCIFEEVPEETTVTVRVRAAVSFHDALIHGDWSIPVTFTTPRTLPPAVIDIKYTSESSLLSWECMDQSSDLQFTVEVSECSTQRLIMKVTTKEKNVVLDGVQPGNAYSAVLTSCTKVGRTPHHTNFDFVAPAQKPSAPGNGAQVTALTDKCTVFWTAAEDNGSPITGYVIKLYLNKKLLRQSFLPTHDEINYRVNMKELLPNTEYTISISGRNKVGDGEPILIPVVTKPLPPVAPEIECDAESCMLKLHWKPVTSSSSIAYKVMRVNDRGQQMPIYEGENNTVKVRNLTEDTEYSFVLRVTDKTTGADAWSENYVFRTTVAPPRPIKQSPSCSLVSGQSYLYSVTWKDVLPINNVHKQFYRLQVADATVPGAKWTVAYEGVTSMYELNTESFPGALHVRVLVVRPDEGNEVKGSPSPVGYIGNEPPVVDVEPEIEESDRRSFLNWQIFGVHPAIILMCLVLFIVFMFNFSETLFNWVTGTPSNSTSSVVDVPRPPPPTITPTRPPGAQ